MESHALTARERSRRVAVLSAPMAVAALVVVSAVGRLLLARSVPTPWIAPDEMIYGLLGRTLYSSGHLAVLTAPTGFYSLLYPVLIGSPLALGDAGLGYSIAKALGAIVMSLAAVPVYLWARMLVSRRLAVAAAALTLALPALAYSGLLMTEVLFYPLLALASWAIARALVEPTRGRQAVVVLVIAAAALTRLQGIVLAPVLVTAILLCGRPRAMLRAFAPSLIALAAGAAAWLAWRGIAGGGALGAYSVVASHGYDAGEIAKFVVYHLADLVLLTGFVPVCAAALLVFERRTLGRAERACLAVAVSLSAWLVLEVGVFASRYVGRLAERDLIGAAPALFVVLAVWLERGAPRGRLLRSGTVVLVAAALVTVLPLHTLLKPEAMPDAFTLIPFFRLAGSWTTSQQQLLLDGSVAVAAILVALLPRRALAVTPVILVALLGAGSVSASDYVASNAGEARATMLGPDRQWIDNAADGPVTFLYDGSDEFNLAWETLFWNGRVNRVVTIRGARLLGPAPGARPRFARDGTLAGERAEYVAAPAASLLDGVRVANAGVVDGTPVPVNLWRVGGAVRVGATLGGFQPNGDIYDSASVSARGCLGKALHVTLIAKEVRAREPVPQRTVLREPATLAAHGSDGHGARRRGRDRPLRVRDHDVGPPRLDARPGELRPTTSPAT